MEFLGNHYTSFEELFESLTSGPHFLKIKTLNNYFLITHTNKTPMNKFTQELFGIIGEKTNLKIISKAFNKMWEINGKYNDEEIHELIATHEFFNTSSIQFEEAVDGTMIRLFYHDNEWKKATKNCINAYDAFWNNSKSFGEMFDDCAFNLDYNLLNKNYFYTFVIQHSQNRIIYPYTQNTMIHLSSINSLTMKEEDIDIGISKPMLFSFNNIQELFYSFSNTPWTFQGYILINEHKDRLKIENPNYTYVKELKGNNVNVYVRILQLLHDRKKNEFLKYFPEYQDIVDSIILDIQHLATKIHRTYIQRYVKKNPNYPQPEEYTTFLKKLDWLYHQFQKPTEYKDVLHVTMDCPILKLASTLGYIQLKN
jgi:hypothetical protein